MNPTLSENWGTLRKTALEERVLEEIRKSNRYVKKIVLDFHILVIQEEGKSVS